ncbi:MAG: hypothetical protein GF313_17610 [Caldithrix sp.]|nr:hypothetical protein [Caldithrix sp.]
MKRRGFIKSSLALAGAVGSLPLITSCAGVHRRSFAEFKKGDRMMDSAPKELMEILNYGALAPSGHNTQPWLVKIISESELVIQSDQSRWLPQVDPNNRETFLSLTAFAESIRLAARSSGWNAQIKRIADSRKDQDVFKITLKRTSTTQQNDLQLLKQRSTTRSNYETREINNNTVMPLIGVDRNHVHYYPLQSHEGRWIADNLPEAIKQQSFNDAKQKELAQWLRFSRDTAEKRQDGLTAEALGMNWMTRFIWYNFFNRDTAMGNSFRKKAVETAHDQVNHCSGFLVLTSQDDALKSHFECGKLYQQISLKLTEMDMVHHTMSQLLEEEPWSSQIRTQLNLNDPVQFVIRVGYGEKARPSIRRPVKSFIIE